MAVTEFVRWHCRDVGDYVSILARETFDDFGNQALGAPRIDLGDVPESVDPRTALAIGRELRWAAAAMGVR